MNAAATAFFDSLTAGVMPPSSASAPLQAVWHGLNGDGQAAHRITQDEDSTEGAWVMPGSIGWKAISATRPIGTGGLDGAWRAAISARKGS